jgi:hypothetical protein
MTELIRDEFQVHLLNSEGIDRAKALAYLFSKFLNDVESITGNAGREVSIIRTKLQEASYFAKRAVATRVENQQVAP